MNETEGKRHLWWQWTIGTGVGYGVSMWLDQSALFLVGPVLIGVGQWIVIRQHFSRAGSWLIVTPVGFLIGVSFGGVLGGFLQDVMDGIASSPAGIASLEPGRSALALLVASAIAGAFIGILLGGTQWLVLRRQARQPGLWLLANVGSFAFATALNTIRLIPLGADGLVVGAFTGLALTRCLRESARAGPAAVTSSAT